MIRMKMLFPMLAAAAALALAPTACANGADDTATAASPATSLSCAIAAAGQALPLAVPETSGLARGGARPELFWTHNDSGGGAEIFAIDGSARLTQAVAVDGAGAVDWEDIAAAPCSGGHCLFIGDIGDNGGERESVAIYRIAEPAAGAERAAAFPIPLRYPDRARDAEALLAVDGRLYIVSKGREESVRLFRVPETAEGEAVGILEPVVELAPPPEAGSDWVTAAAASPDGRWVAVRTYRTLLVYEADPLLRGQPTEPRRFDLTPLHEPQGEGLEVGNAGEVWLTSEAPGGGPPTWSRLTCELD